LNLERIVEVLTDEEKKDACKIIIQAGAHFVKTSTGFGPGGATVKDIRSAQRKINKRLESKDLNEEQRESLENSLSIFNNLEGIVEKNTIMPAMCPNILAEIIGSEELGKKIGILHSNNIIHGDLTTSNMILDNEIKFIDFGLSFFSTKEEDKAVDLHLLRQALESKHHDIWEKCFEAALKGYKKSYPEHSIVLNRLQKVEARGRNKHKF